jgi:CoA:oxalate CoA-transferase
VLFDKADLPYSPVNSIKDICADPHIRYRNMLVDIDQPEVGKMSITGSPIHLSETPGEVYAPAPRLGQHTEEILRDLLNYSQIEIDQLKREGIISGEN